MSTSSSNSLPDVESAAAWKLEVNERLAAHRSRRTRRGDEYPTLPGLEADATGAGNPLKSSIAAKVAARYAKAPTYGEMLAAEAQNAATAAAAAAKAAGEAQAAAQAILTGLDLREEGYVAAKQPESPAPRRSESTSGRQGASPPAWGAEGRGEIRNEHRGESRAESRNENKTETKSETRREPWQDALPAAAVAEQVEKRAPVAKAPLRITLAEEEAVAIAYETPEPIPGNLIEFPRELFATRRARPRHAEGPLQEMDAEDEASQLRIFEVEPESISRTATVEYARAEWAPIRLGAHPAHDVDGRAQDAQPARHEHAAAQPSSALELPLQTACLEDRTMAAVVDFALVTAAFLSFVLAFSFCTPHLPMGKPALIAAAVCYFVLAVGYQLLFFAYAESTPGMRYAKIALCTFDDENPTRKAMRVRVAAMLLSLCPLGLGCAWVFFDEDHLSWHDRLTRSYQRSYR